MISKLICVRGRKLSDTILETKEKYYQVDMKMYDKREAYYQLKYDTSEKIYKVIKGIKLD